MPQRCSVCNAAELIFDADALSWICSRCGVLLDPTQVVIDHSPAAADDFYLWKPTTTTHADGRPIWSLQTTETKRDRRRASAHSLIRQVLVGLGRYSDPLHDRARILFDIAQRKASRTWGSTRSETVAGVAVAIAIREANLPESLGEIATLLCRPPIVITRAYRRLKDTLGLDLAPNDPHIYLTMLTSHLVKLLAETSPGPFTQTTKDYLTMPSFGPVLDLAMRLLRIVESSRSAGDRLPSAVACGALLLAFEAEQQKPVPGKEKVAHVLAARLGIRGYTVMDRYREIARLVSSLKDELPRSIGANLKTDVRGQKARVSWLKDTVLLWDVLEAQRRQAQEVSGRWRNEDAQPVDEEDASGSEAADWSSASSNDVLDDEGSGGRRARHASASASRGATRGGEEGTGGVEGAVLPDAWIGPSGASSERGGVLAAAASLLAGSGAEGEMEGTVWTRGALLQSATAVGAVWGGLEGGGRLRALAALRGGGEHVLDSELFDAGELAGYLRSEEEAEALGRAR